MEGFGCLKPPISVENRTLIPDSYRDIATNKKKTIYESRSFCSRCKKGPKIYLKGFLHFSSSDVNNKLKFTTTKNRYESPNVDLASIATLPTEVGDGHEEQDMYSP